MTDNIIPFYKKNAAESPDSVLEQAIGEYSSVVVIGRNHDGELDARASLNLSHAEVNWLISVFQQKLLIGDYGTEE